MGCEHDYKESSVDKVCLKCGHKVCKTEIYSRVVGYIRPVSNWNDSKQSEFHDRKLYDFKINGDSKKGMSSYFLEKIKQLNNQLLFGGIKNV